ncbi:MAG: hypothetical protein AABX47_10025 [Nanoarchaeota archaeon]
MVRKAKKKSLEQGQVTIYIIITVIAVVALIAFTIKMPNKAEFAQLEAEDYLSDAKADAKACLDDMLVNVLRDVGDSGRLEFKHPIQLFDGMVETFSIDGENLMPSSEELAQEASRQLDEEVTECIAQEWAERPQRFKTGLGTVKTKITFSETHAVVAAKIPLEVTEFGKSYTSEDFSSNIPLRFLTTYRTAETLAGLAQEDPTKIDPELLLSQPVHVTIKTISPTSYLYELSDEKSLIDGAPYLYRFAVSYTGEPR